MEKFKILQFFFNSDKIILSLRNLPRFPQNSLAFSPVPMQLLPEGVISFAHPHTCSLERETKQNWWHTELRQAFGTEAGREAERLTVKSFNYNPLTH